MSSMIKLFSPFIILMILECFFTILFKSSWYRGKVGEKQAENALRILSKRGIYGRIIKNVYLTKENGETSELDVVYITAVGLFVLECKNYKGWIFGSEKSEYWTVTLPSGKGRSRKYKFYNPLKQNLSHIPPLNEYLKKAFPDKTIPVFPIVVFTERASLKKVNVYSDYQPVIYIKDINMRVTRIIAENDPVLTNNQVDELYEKMKGLTQVSRQVKKKHIKAVRLKAVR